MAVPAGINMSQASWDKLVGNIQAKTPTPTPSPTPVVTNTNTGAVSNSSGAQGEFVYGTDPVKSKALDTNVKTWANDPVAKQAEIDRTLGIIKNMQGQDTSAQQKHLTQTLGYVEPTVDKAPVEIIPTNSTNTSTPNPTNNLSSFQQSQTGLINDIYANQRASQLQKIREARDIQLQGLNKVNVQAEDSATAQRGQIAAADIQAGQRLRESMASMGLLGSGDNLTAQGQQATIRQSAMGQTNQELARVRQDVSERQKQINDAAANNDLALLQKLQADQAQDMLTLGYQVNDREYRDAVFGWQQQIDTANQTGIFNGQQNMAMQNQQFNQGQQGWQNRYNYGLATGTFENGQQSLENKKFQYTQGRDTVADQQWESEFQRIKEQNGIENALNWAQNSISQQNADTSATNASNSASNSSIDNLMNVFKATGVAPAGLESMGINKGDKLPIETKPVDYNYTTDPAFIGGIADAGTGGLTSAEILKDAKNIINDITYDGYQKLLSAAKVYEASQNTLTW